MNKNRCYFNNKGLCKKDSCNYVHAEKTCPILNKTGFCQHEQNCVFRHPRTVCRFWIRGFCSKGEKCQFRHPETFLERDLQREREKIARGDRHVNLLSLSPSLCNFPPLQTEARARPNSQPTKSCSIMQGSQRACSCQSPQ